MKDYEFHPLCLAFPEMEPDAYARRLADYRKHPKRAKDMKVLLAQDDADGEWKILDGRHHYRICKELGYDCEFEKFDGDREAVADVAEARGIDRRHMTETQIAASLYLLNDWRHGGDRKSETVKPNQDAPVHLDKPKRGKSKGKTQTAAAKSGGVSVRTVRSVTTGAKANKGLLPHMRDGKLDAKTAEKISKLPPEIIEQIANSADPKKAATEALKKQPAKPKTAPVPESEATEEQEEAIAALESTEPEQDAGDAFVSQVETLCRDMDKIAARIKELKANPRSYPIHLDSAASQVEAARKTLWQGRPCHKCPYCRGEGCPTCKSTGRVKKTTYDSGREAVGGD